MKRGNDGWLYQLTGSRECVDIKDVLNLQDAHLIVGNGFSAAADPRFEYGTLLGVAETEGYLSSLPATEVFRQLDTVNFEHAIKALVDMKSMLFDFWFDGWGEPDTHRELAARIVQTTKEIRTALHRTLVAVHPEYAALEQRFGHVAEFLSRFKSIYTLNYDLLLYWAILNGRTPDGPLSARFQDGFGRVGGDLCFDAGRPCHVWYLHGALHLVQDINGRVKKLSSSKEASVLAQIKSRLVGDCDPLVVTEGTSKEKVLTISTSPYLTAATAALRQAKGSLVVFGSSISKEDHHIWQCIDAPERIREIYVGVRGERDFSFYQAPLELPSLRQAGRLRFFSTAAFEPWGPAF